MESEQDAPMIAILRSLSAVIDPETSVDLVRMGLIRDLTVCTGGLVAHSIPLHQRRVPWLRCWPTSCAMWSGESPGCTARRSRSSATSTLIR